MSIIAQTQRYLPHEMSTKIKAVKMYRSGETVSFVCRKYHISKASLMRWNKQYDGSYESLYPKSHKPLTPHPNSHTETELKWISDYKRRNPNITACELYGKLHKDKGYSRHPLSLYRVLNRLNYRVSVESTKKRSKHPGKYATPENIGEKWQMDVKYVPTACYTGKYDDERFYQYTMIEEATRKRFIYPYNEQSSFTTIDFVKRAIEFFGYKPKIIQTDNGAEFTHFKRTKRIHPLDILCEQLNIIHKLIRPRTPWHNGKVERSHRNDQERFYNHLRFYSYSDLFIQMQAYLRRSNNIPMAVLGWKSPNEKQKELEAQVVWE